MARTPFVTATRTRLQNKKPRLPEGDRGCGCISTRPSRAVGHESVTHDCAAKFGDDDVNAVAAAGKLVGQDLAAEDTVAASIEARDHIGTACRNASRNGVSAARAWVFDAPLDLHRRWRAAYRCGLAANRSGLTAGRCGVASSLGVVKQASLGRSRGSKHQHGRSHASGDEMT